MTLCVSDLKFVNFIKDLNNKIVAVDFGGYSFLPPSFFDFVLRYGDPSSFAHRISGALQHPPSLQVPAMMSASFALAPFATNDVGEQVSLLLFFSFFLTLAPFFQNANFNVLHRSSRGAQIQLS